MIGTVQLLRSDRHELETLLGEPKKAVRSMFLPFLIAFAIIEANQFIDTFWISGLGTQSASAISTVVPFYVLLMSAGIGISVGATTTVAFRVGKGDNGMAEKLAANALNLGVLMSILASVILFFGLDPAMDLLGVDSIRKEWREEASKEWNRIESMDENAAANQQALNSFDKGEYFDFRLEVIDKSDNWNLTITYGKKMRCEINSKETDDIKGSIKDILKQSGFSTDDTYLCILSYNGEQYGTAKAFRAIDEAIDDIQREYPNLYFSNLNK